MQGSLFESTDSPADVECVGLLAISFLLFIIEEGNGDCNSYRDQMNWNLSWALFFMLDS